MVKDHPVFELFVSGSSSGIDSAFFCTLCQRDVSIAAKGVREITRHFASDKHWYNKLLDPMELNESQIQEYLSRPCKEKPEGFSFPEDLLPSCTRVDSSVPMMTKVNCLIEMLRSGGDYLFLRKLWGHFRATLASENPLYNLTWSRGESLVRHFCVFLFLLFSLVAVITSCSVASGVCHVVFSGVEYCFVSDVTVPGFVPTSSAFAGSPHW